MCVPTHARVHARAHAHTHQLLLNFPPAMCQTKQHYFHICRVLHFYKLATNMLHIRNVATSKLQISCDTKGKCPLNPAI